tara:strand:- start:4861 stop:5037 length:177 start_codon:yes stop_codon:yes gene_type:complete
MVMTLIIMGCSDDKDEIMPLDTEDYFNDGMDLGEIDTEDYFNDGMDLGEIDTGTPNNV